MLAPPSRRVSRTPHPLPTQRNPRGGGRPGSPRRGSRRLISWADCGERQADGGASSTRLLPPPLPPAGRRARAGSGEVVAPAPGGGVRAAAARPGGSPVGGAHPSERRSPPRARRARPAAAPAGPRPCSRNSRGVHQPSPLGPGRARGRAACAWSPPSSQHRVAHECRPDVGAAASSRGGRGPGNEDPADARSPRESPGGPRPDTGPGGLEIRTPEVASTVRTSFSRGLKRS